EDTPFLASHLPLTRDATAVKLDPLLDAPLTDKFKGIPSGTAPFPLGEIAGKRWNVLNETLPLPLPVIKRAALAHNSRWMQAFVELTGVRIAPHGKTTMSPQLFAQQLADGAWGMTFATTHQVRIAREFGVARIIMANQLLGRVNIDYILDELAHDPAFEFFCLVDSVAGVELLATAARAKNIGRPLCVLLEAGAAGARCGVRNIEAAREVANAVKQHEPYLSLRGVEGFEGSVSGPTPAETLVRIAAFGDFIVQIARECEQAALFGGDTILLSAGGSAYYDVVVQRLSQAGLSMPSEIVIRSGCYLTHDSIFYRNLHELLQTRFPKAAQLGSGLQPALEVWAYVQSRPEPTRVILTCGKRDISFDLHLPVLEQWYCPRHHTHPQPIPVEHALVGLNDQHAMCNVPSDSPLAVGDMVSLGISHPCTTFDRWQWLPLVDEEYNVVEAIRTFF
ncbi:MAG TPA: amino acid deaminase, partial [Pirellulaceae bacterium]|nr:amino acid deaminase [Pirellulaceae bacterium]